MTIYVGKVMAKRISAAGDGKCGGDQTGKSSPTSNRFNPQPSEKKQLS
jgi:hypothetical protein